MEFLEKDGRRVAAFGIWAGFAGAALALKNWAWQLAHPDGAPLPGVESHLNEASLVREVKESLAKGTSKAGRAPRVIVIGALGRCGRGAVDLCLKAGLPKENILKWDLAKTAPGGPFKEVVESDIFVNCIYLNKQIPPFVTVETLNSPDLKLSVINDCSADTTNPFNPVPVYTVATTFNKPTVPVEGLKSGPPLSAISIDHLPSLPPREASESFSNDLLP
ncbi:hypothetical protein RB595_003750 [Gaeumannomyces hyphopodioides]